MDNRIYTLFSGSAGNCHYLCAGETEILFDAGKNAKAVKTALAEVGSDLSRIRAIFLTHSHGDHVSALRVLLRQAPHLIVYLSRECAEGLTLDGELYERLRVLSPFETVSVGSVSVLPFPVPHDSGGCFGYRAEYGEGTARFGLATDIGYMTNDVASGLLGCDSVVVECNHDTDMLIRGPYPPELKQRILSRGGHLSNDSCARLLAYLCENGTHRVMLAHLSRENNTPDTALFRVREAIGARDCCVFAADPDVPTMLCDEEI